jgi:hypothetical protein
MKISRRIEAVRAAQARMALARLEAAAPAAALLDKGYENPLTVMGMAAGAGFLLGAADIGPGSVAGVTSLVGGGLTEWAVKAAFAAVGNFMDDSQDSGP